MSESKSLKLFRVNIEHDIWVVAEDASEAADHAGSALRDEIDNMEVWPQQVTSSTPMDADWAESIPYGDHATDDTVVAWREKLGVKYVMPEQLKKLSEQR